MYLATLLGYESNCLNCQGIVVAVYENSVDILVPSLYFKTTLYLDKYDFVSRLESHLWAHQVSWSTPKHVQSISLLSIVPVCFKKCAYNFNVNVDLRHPLNLGPEGKSLLVDSQGSVDLRVGPSILSQMSASDITALCKNATNAPGPGGLSTELPASKSLPHKPTADKPKRERTRNKKGKSESSSDTTASNNKPTHPGPSGPGTSDPTGSQSSSWFESHKMSKGEARAAAKQQTKIKNLLESQIQSLTMNSSDSESEPTTDENKKVPERHGGSFVKPPPSSDPSERHGGSFVKPPPPSDPSVGSSLGLPPFSKSSAGAPPTQSPRPQTLSSDGALASPSKPKVVSQASTTFKSNPFLIPETSRSSPAPARPTAGTPTRTPQLPTSGTPTTTPTRSTPYSYSANTLSHNTTAAYAENSRPSSSSSSNTQSPTGPRKPKQPDNCVVS
ncbi:hypothetical protein WDU94_006135 [Cyamophila willieti]